MEMVHDKGTLQFVFFRLRRCVGGSVERTREVEYLFLRRKSTDGGRRNDANKLRFISAVFERTYASSTMDNNIHQ